MKKMQSISAHPFQLKNKNTSKNIQMSLHKITSCVNMTICIMNKCKGKCMLNARQDEDERATEKKQSQLLLKYCFQH